VSIIDRERTDYSPVLPGERGNYNWPVRYDMTGGFLGITQIEGDTVKDRVLLSPKQVRELTAFIRKKSKR
jgi:hypothetical protein